MAWLRRIRGRSRRERIRNERTREELGAEETVIEKIKRRRLTWFGHVERMDGKRLHAKCSTAWACERRKKQRKTKEETNVSQDL